MAYRRRRYTTTLPSTSQPRRTSARIRPTTRPHAASYPAVHLLSLTAREPVPVFRDSRVDQETLPCVRARLNHRQEQEGAAGFVLSVLAGGGAEYHRYRRHLENTPQRHTGAVVILRTNYSACRRRPSERTLHSARTR